MEREAEGDFSRQCDEVEALKSIYGSEDVSSSQTSDGNLVITVQINESGKRILLRIENPQDYPSKSVPFYEISAPFLRGKAKSELCGKLEVISETNEGESIIYLWVEEIRSFLTSEFPEVIVPNNEAEQESLPVDDIPTPQIITSSYVIEDRKSIFQAHIGVVHSGAQVTKVIATLLENKKVAQATHNISAYRIRSEDKDVIISDCNDDGENNAGSRLLHLLDISGVENVLVVVSRWYGGIQLGPDRFKHINNAARNILEENGLLKKHSKGLKSKK